MKVWKIALPVCAVALCLTAFAAKANLFDHLRDSIHSTINQMETVIHNQQVRAAMAQADKVQQILNNQASDLENYFEHGKDYNQIHNGGVKATVEGLCKLGCNFVTCSSGLVKTTCTKACPDSDTPHCRSATVKVK